MITSDLIVAAADAVDALRTYLRIDCADEDAVLSALIASAMASCEAFIGETLLERGFVETIDGCARWSRLSAAPVVAVTGVAQAVDDTPLNISDYAIDIDADGTGKVRLNGLGMRIAVSYRAGRASNWSAIAEPVRHGIVRLAAARYGARDRSEPGDAGGAVTALWRGARRMRLA